MRDPRWGPGDSAKCKQIWADYQQKHDLSERYGQTAGIDPKTGRIWFGESIEDVVDQRAAVGLKNPLFFMRVGHKTYFLKKGRSVFQGKVSDAGVPTIQV